MKLVKYEGGGDINGRVRVDCVRGIRGVNIGARERRPHGARGATWESCPGSHV